MPNGGATEAAVKCSSARSTCGRSAKLVSAPVLASSLDAQAFELYVPDSYVDLASSGVIVISDERSCLFALMLVLIAIVVVTAKGVKYVETGVPAEMKGARCTDGLEIDPHGCVFPIHVWYEHHCRFPISPSNAEDFDRRCTQLPDCRSASSAFAVDEIMSSRI